MTKLFKLLIIAVVVTVPLPQAYACQIGWRNPAELQSEAGIVATALVISATQLSTSVSETDYQYRTKIEAVERGDIKQGELDVTYQDLKAHLRGTSRVCPVKNGSGIEHDLKPGMRYKLFIRSASEPEILIAELIKK